MIGPCSRCHCSPKNVLWPALSFLHKHGQYLHTPSPSCLYKPTAYLFEWGICLAQNKGHFWSVNNLMTPGENLPSRDRGVLINVPASASLVVPQQLLARLRHHIPNVICTPAWDSASATVWTVSESVVTLNRLRRWGSSNEYMNRWLTGSLWTSGIHSNGSHEDHRIVCQRKRIITLLYKPAINILWCPGSQRSSLEAFKETPSLAWWSCWKSRVGSV